MQEQPCTATHDGIGRHQLRMRETFIYVFVDDVRLIQHQIALHQHRHFAIGIDRRDIFRLVHQVHVNYLKIHALLEQHDPTAMTIGARRPGIQSHHNTDYPLTNWMLCKRIRTKKKPIVATTPLTTIAAKMGYVPTPPATFARSPAEHLRLPSPAALPSSRLSQFANEGHRET